MSAILYWEGHLAVQHHQVAPLHKASRHVHSIRARAWDNLLGTADKTLLPCRPHPQASHRRVSSNHLLARIQNGKEVGCL